MMNLQMVVVAGISFVSGSAAILFPLVYVFSSGYLEKAIVLSVAATIGYSIGTVATISFLRIVY